MQVQLTQFTQTWRYGRIGSWIVASILFGLVHIPGGWVYACLASVAGLFYGYAYLRTQKIEGSILVHFSVNAIHFLAFTYPALKGMK